MNQMTDPNHIAKSINNTGFGANSNFEGGRLVNKDGTNNLKKKGMPFFQRFSLYHVLLRLSKFEFVFLVFGFYTFLNLFFASLYLLIGVDQLTGTEHSESFLDQFEQAFFFSAQTLTTVGYGHISPHGTLSNIISSLESFVGIMVFAIVTGLFFARFSRPQAYLKFSDNILISPYKDFTGLMFRIAASRNNHLTSVEARVTCAFHIIEDGKRVNKFFTLPLEIDKINSLALSWTIVHPINQDSPLWGMTEEELLKSKIEIIPSIKAFDDHYSNTVLQRTSYTGMELIYGAKFLPAFYRSEDGSHTLLELDKLNSFERVAI
jgi:inward rectifier potassium channel